MTRPRRFPTALLSIHDVMPETLERADRLTRLAEQSGCPRPTLLIVPGKNWDAPALDWVRGKSEAGYPLAGHGWMHRAGSPRSVFHRIHGAVISADQAEHLSLPREEVCSIVERCHAWFSEKGLSDPQAYVPPAWALGALTRADLRALPFRRYETLTGFIDARSGRFVRVPLVGFEASSTAVAWAIRASNRVNRLLGAAFDRPVRVCLHPSDLELRLGSSLTATLERDWSWAPDSDFLFASP